MKNWLKQTSTIGGFLSLAATGLQTYKSGGDWVTVVLAVITAALLIVKDGKFLAGLCFCALLGGAQTACAKIPMTPASQIDVATEIGCAFLGSAKEAASNEAAPAALRECYGEITAALPFVSVGGCRQVLPKVFKAADSLKGVPPEDYGKKLNEALLSIGRDAVDVAVWDPRSVDWSRLLALRKGRCRDLAGALGVK
jgi:hypothetical protein